MKQKIVFGEQKNLDVSKQFPDFDVTVNTNEGGQGKIEDPTLPDYVESKPEVSEVPGSETMMGRASMSVEQDDRIR
jgi:hypothetical protein